MKIRLLQTFITLAFLATIRQVVAQGSLDASFNTGSGAEDDVQTLAVQSDGKIIAAGLFYDINGTTNSLGVARLNTNGIVDATFNPGTSVDFGINSVAIQSDGKIILVGGFTQYQGTSRNGITRINADGSLDTTFDPGTGVNDQISSIAIQSDGKAVIAGYFTTYNGTARSGIARLNADGTLDTTFNPGAGVNFAVDSVNVLINGQVLIGGGFTTYNGTTRRGVARINSNGSVDTGFNPGTISANDLVRIAIAQPDGKVVVGGDFTKFDNVSRNSITRLNADGTLDTTFNPGTGANGSVMALAVQPNGKLLMGGNFTTVNTISLPGIARLLSNGAVDTNFNPGTGANGNVEALALQNDGKVVLGGSFTTINSQSDVDLARLLLNDPQPVQIVTRITNLVGNFVLNWPATLNAVYRAEYKTSLATGNWTPLSPYVTAVGSTAVLTNNPAGDQQRYYRIAWLPF
jgi:uncharacterized delta-60 repeat protein